MLLDREANTDVSKTIRTLIVVTSLCVQVMKAVSDTCDTEVASL